jgi:hypothetical protein
MGLLQTRQSGVGSSTNGARLAAAGKPDESGCGFGDHRGALIWPTMNGAVIRLMALVCLLTTPVAASAQLSRSLSPANRS